MNEHALCVQDVLCSFWKKQRMITTEQDFFFSIVFLIICRVIREKILIILYNDNTCFRKRQWFRHERKSWIHVFVKTMFEFLNLSTDDLFDFFIVLYRLRSLFSFLWVFLLSLLHCYSQMNVIMHRCCSRLWRLSLKNNWVLLTRQDVSYRSWILTRTFYYIFSYIIRCHFICERFRSLSW